MRKLAAALLVLGLFLAALWGGSSAGWWGDGDGAEKKRKPKFTVSKGTTYATGPLDVDGIIDYAEALNERLGKGVKPATNANVLLWKAFGPRSEVGKPMPPEFFKWMGT